VVRRRSDAQRRDFTCNAIYLDVGSGAVLDPTGGRADLAARRLQTIGEPRRRFGEDALRLLRALRFCRWIGGELAPATAAAAVECAPLLAQLAAERVYERPGPSGPERGARCIVELASPPCCCPRSQRWLSRNRQRHPEATC
jgi:hypothetical protein